MRPIKFRAWNRKINKMELVDTIFWSNPKYGGIDFVNTDDGHKLYSQCYDEDEGKAEFVLMRFIGLLDKHQIEIYEGDVITGINGNRNEIRGEVIFENGTFCLRGLTLNWEKKREILRVWDDGVNDWHSIENLYDITIHGNIYEHPELLKL